MRLAGTGDTATVIDFYGVVSDKEIHCPECDPRIGILKEGQTTIRLAKVQRT
jgi:hypothetical protein